MEQNAWLESVINKCIKEKSISRVLRVDFKDAVPSGSNYASTISRVTINAVLKSGTKVKLYVIIKSQLQSEKKQKVIEFFNAFKNETTVYKHIFEKCELLMNEYGDFNDKLWCKLIGYQPYNLIAFEDLKEQNFRLSDRLKMLDLNHSKLVLQSLGRLHGICHVLIKKGYLTKTDLPPSFPETDSPVVKNLFAGGLQKLVQVINKYWSKEWKPIANRIEKESDVVIDKIRNLYKSLPHNTFLTFNHGDCWTCNIMFKYCPYDDNLPIALKFLDLQISHINTYIFDVIHFLNSSTLPKVRRQHFDELLQIYQKSLASTLAIYGMERDTPSLEHVRAEAERVKYYGHIVALVIQPVTLANVKNGFNIEHLGDGQNGTDAFSEDLFNIGLPKENIQEELKYWYKNIM